MKLYSDDFNRERVAAPADNVWWRGSNGEIVPRHVELKEGGAYAVENAQAALDKNYLALTARGELSDLSLVPLTNGIEGDPIAWGALVGKDGEVLINSTHNYETVVIDLAASGVAADVTGFKLTTTTRVFVKGLFYSNLETIAAAEQWPYVDIANAIVFDDFNGRVQSDFHGDYELAITDPATVEAGLLYILSYNNGNLVRIENNVMTFDATSLGASDYINLKIAAGPGKANEGRDYLVLSVKALEGATLDGLRIAGVSPAPTYFGDWKAAFGVPVPSLDNLGNYPYVDADGFTYLVIDLEHTGFDFADVIDIYYSGSGKLVFNSILFANAPAPYDLAKGLPVGDASNEVALGGGYAYTYGGNVGENPYYALTLTGDGAVDLSSLRLAGSAGTSWFKDGVILDPYGNVISVESVELLAGTPVQIVIDLIASGIGGGDIHIHAGDAGEAAGTLTIGEKLAVPASWYEKVVDSTAHTVTISADYAYGWGLDYANPGRYLVLEVTGDGVAGLGSMRIETAGATIYAHSLVLQNGDLLGDYIPTVEGDTIVIDLIASGYDYYALGGAMHFHFGDAAATAGEVTFSKVAFADYSTASYVGLLPA